ncbi:MAG: MBL fold metallo-hydrolase [Streptosporangiales bacterium]|nr:MBL fold metallo-hydrolase [Streptosporangiales bacterium]
MTARVEQVVTSGRSPGEEGERDVENNVWIVGDDDEVIVVDAGHDAEAILEAVGDREVLAVICTHGLDDHVSAAVEVAERDEALVALHARDSALWRAVYPDHGPDVDIEEGGIFEVAEIELEVLHTPGHTPGGVCLYSEELEVVFAGDTLLKGGPPPADGPHGDFPTLLNSIGEKLLTLPPETRVLSGHGEETTIGDEEPSFDDWVARSI